MNKLFYCQDCRMESEINLEILTSAGDCRTCGGENWRQIDHNRKVIGIAVDTEFTSFDKLAGDVIDIGMVEILDDYTLGREGQWYARPTSAKYFTEKAQEVHGISYFKAQTFPTKRESCISMMNWLRPLVPQFPLKFVFHGQGSLDHAHLQEHFRREELTSSFYKAFPDHMVESTLKLSREKLKQLQSHKLKELTNFYKIPLDDHHSALPDARACAIIYCKLMQGEDVWTGQLI